MIIIVQCVDCTPNEKRTLEFLQTRGIRSKNALAVVMGNIQQESRFDTLICEGGFRTGYHDCHRGGFGLIQWTTPNRYRGLGKSVSYTHLRAHETRGNLVCPVLR